MEHAPERFVVTMQDDDGLILHAMCKCGDEECGWSVFVPAKDWYSNQIALKHPH